MRQSELEANVHTLVEVKALNLEVTLGSFLKAGALAGLDPWDIWCGNGWVVRRRGPVPRFIEIESIRNVVREELQGTGALRG